MTIKIPRKKLAKKGRCIHVHVHVHTHACTQTHIHSIMLLSNIEENK